MDRLTRKELKTDHFAVAVQHRVEYLAGHKKQLVRYGIAAIAIVIVLIAVYWYRQHAHTVREEALASALKIQNASVGPPQEGVLTFPTDADRQKAANKAFSELAAKYPGTQEGDVAEYYLGTAAADSGNMQEAEKRFKQVADSGNAGLASMGKLDLAQVYAAEGKMADAEKILRDLMNHPTALVSKEQATFALAHVIEKSKPEEARKLLDPYRTNSRAPISRAAITALGNIPKQ